MKCASPASAVIGELVGQTLSMRDQALIPGPIHRLAHSGLYNAPLSPNTRPLPHPLLPSSYISPRTNSQSRRALKYVITGRGPFLDIRPSTPLCTPPRTLASRLGPMGSQDWPTGTESRRCVLGEEVGAGFGGAEAGIRGCAE